jgi:chemotaxis protein methyltransferase CheR
MLEEVQTFLLQRLGWNIDIHEPIFEVKLKRICKELGFDAIQPCVESLKERETDTKTVEAFAREYSVGESYFFRDMKFFDYLAHNIFPRIVQKKERTLSIWSIGCSSGEELYSIAILLRNTIADIDMWRLYLLGTDVNTNAIEQANSGVFTKFSFRQTPEQYMHYFQANNFTYEISQKIKEMVHFKYHNIISEPYSCLPPSAERFDLILIKNVLIYFDKESAKKAVTSIFHLLKEGGYLATTPAEYSEGIFNLPHSKYLPNLSLIEKDFKPYEEIIVLKNEPEIIETVIENLLESVPKPKPLQSLLDEKSKQGCYSKALELLKIGDMEGAKVYLKHALYLDKDLVMAHILLGNILKKERKLESAIKHLENAKAILSRMQPQEVVEFSDGIMGSDLLFMLNSIKGEEFE